MPEVIDSTARPTRVRIAPSPTGDPHVGTAYIGLINYLYARQNGGQFVLRIEDTDRTRFVSTSEQMIFDALRWLGLQWDEGPDVGGPYGPYRQSERTEIYRVHADQLVASGAAYRCFCTAEKLESDRQQQIAAKLPPRYPGTCRSLAPDTIGQNLAAGAPFVVRMKVPGEGSTTFTDQLRGAITFEHRNVDDQVLLKSDGYPTYHLANVVDDHLMRITDVIRAEEWISSTPKHVLLYQAFGWELPQFWHMPLLRNQDKSKISKRKNPVSLIYYREAGYLPQAVINFLGLLGGGMPADFNQGTEKFTLSEMEENFQLKNVRTGGPVFDLTKLKWLNGEYLRAMSLDEFYSALRSTVLADGYLRSIAELVQTRIELLSQFGDLTGFFLNDNTHPSAEAYLPKNRSREETLAFVGEQLTALEAAAWQQAAIEAALKQLSQEKQWTVKENFMLLRAMVTGSTMSPPLIESMMVFGKARTLDRLRRFLDAEKKRPAAKG
uniref:glutamate--tRNA ligase n=1 Tax=mine drainage metagenome TaxID=410659 RepID=E6QIW2_9ZZZZ